ncbi:hypothetical protein [Tunicatimonas pelagia]|uniref:hypothetical protein n=1 Tax=Tunicatimonas pelagia TaxID=931531 RepID=UPI0026668881|nr:hypothetical protein [Tunicatimonas pelagia]WKN44372.1 hypothetical protein P0M28_05260 [Tunicatimonas pelagia]
MSPPSLTAKELRQLADTDFLLTKAVIHQKAERLLTATQTQLKAYIQDKSPAFPEAVLIRGGKISRGENYQNLPYHVLDYPRQLSQDAIFTLRTMIWWGHELSITWHMAGHSLQQFRAQLENKLPLMKQWHWQICVSDDPWQYHRIPSYYQPALGFEENTWRLWLEKRSFCKFVVFFPFSDWDVLPRKAVTFLDQVVTLLDL